MLTAGLDELQSDPAVTKLRADVARMNRLVSQLLRVARLDAIPVHLGRVNLVEIAAGVVEYLAPWAIAQGRSLGLEKPNTAIFVHGNAEEISDAIRNLVENAVFHTPADTEVTVRVRADGSVTVEDAGPGIPAADRSQIFARFWRGKGKMAPGAGLGLSIVAEIVRLHGGSVEVGDAPEGGASFQLKFQRI
jgi:signal transduction histidine kinase